VKADEDETEVNPSVISESIGTWLGYDSLVTATLEKNEFMSNTMTFD